MIGERLAAIVGDRLKRDEPLAAYTTYRIGGPADYLALARTTDEVIRLVQVAREAGVPWRVIGRGSNLLVADAGVRGLVVRNTAGGLQIGAVQEGRAVVLAEAGLSCANLAGRTARAGLTGLEFAVAIPGTVGGAVVQNAGAHGTEMVDVLTRVEYLDRAGNRRHATVDELALAYRTSRFKRPPRDDVVLTAELTLRPDQPDAALARVDEIRSWRAAHQPTEPSAGSIFTNPSGDYAGRLIEAAGLKGQRVGGAQISPVHANFIVNTGGARATDIAALIELARGEVESRFGVRLEPEVERLGDWPEVEQE